MDEAAPDPTKSEPPRSLWDHLRHHPRVRGHLLRFIPLNRHLHLRLLGVRMSKPEIGSLGEHLAAKHLRRNGRKVLFRNYFGLHRGEVDIVARHGRALTFVEVKTRTSAAFGRPADAVNLEKQRLIQRGALDWLRLLGNPRITIRFDIAEVLLIDGEKPKVNIIENAFSLPDSSMAGR
jgi:Holliday junction resolvase-like predicted endonuclease